MFTKSKIVRICVICKTDFIIQHPRQKTCSEKCHIALKRINEQKRNDRNRKNGYQKKFLKKRCAELEKQIKAIIGPECVVCGLERKRMNFHEINGKKHFSNNRLTTLLYILKHIKDFMPLCLVCHRALHFIAKNNKEKFTELLKLIP